MMRKVAAMCLLATLARWVTEQRSKLAACNATLIAQLIDAWPCILTASLKIQLMQPCSHPCGVLCPLQCHLCERARVQPISKRGTSHAPDLQVQQHVAQVCSEHLCHHEGLFSAWSKVQLLPHMQ